MPREIITDLTTAAGGGRVSVMYFNEASPVADQREDIDTFFSSLAVSLSNTFSYEVRTTGRELDDATGGLTGAWVDSTPYTGVGANVGDVVPDASQLLIRWFTNVIVNGRFLQGRTFVPGLLGSSIDAGNVDPALVAGYTTIAQTMAGSLNGFGVWHRPTLGAGGSFHPINDGGCWSEVAVLRRRRF